MTEPARRQDDAPAGDDRAALAADFSGQDSAAILARYAMRLTIAQAPLLALAAMKPAGSA
jgi:hypothetical protein